MASKKAKEIVQEDLNIEGLDDITEKIEHAYLTMCAFQQKMDEVESKIPILLYRLNELAMALPQ